MIVFSHRPSKLQVQEHYVFNDDKGDVFEREPYVAWFRPAVDGKYIPLKKVSNWFFIFL